MGMYTHLHLDVEIYPMHKQAVEEYVERVPRLRCTSYYFTDQGKNFIEVDQHARQIKDPDGPREASNSDFMHVLHVDISCKNYEGEIEAFLEFLSDKVYTGGDIFFGFKRYENDMLPTLILYNYDTKKFELKEVTING